MGSMDVRPHRRSTDAPRLDCAKAILTGKSPMPGKETRDALPGALRELGLVMTCTAGGTGTGTLIQRV